MKKQLDERLRIKLIDGIAKGNRAQIKEAYDEIKGDLFVVRDFLDLMIVSTDDDFKARVIYDLNPDMQKLMDGTDRENN